MVFYKKYLVEKDVTIHNLLLPLLLRWILMIPDYFSLIIQVPKELLALDLLPIVISILFYILMYIAACENLGWLSYLGYLVIIVNILWLNTRETIVHNDSLVIFFSKGGLY